MFEIESAGDTSPTNNNHMYSSVRTNNSSKASSKRRWQFQQDSFNPLEERERWHYESAYESNSSKASRIRDFNCLEMNDHQHQSETTSSAPWRDLFTSIFASLPVSIETSNVIVISNYLRFAKCAKEELSSIFDQLFNALGVTRLAICSSGPLLLKSANRKTGIVFDASMDRFVYCIAVLNGVAVENKVKLLMLKQGRSVLELKEEIIAFFRELEEDFLKTCLQSGSVLLNNQIAEPDLSTLITTCMNAVCMEINPYCLDESRIRAIPQPIQTNKPHTARINGAFGLIKLNALYSIPKEKWFRGGDKQ